MILLQPELSARYGISGQEDLGIEFWYLSFIYGQYYGVYRLNLYFYLWPLMAEDN